MNSCEKAWALTALTLNSLLISPIYAQNRDAQGSISKAIDTYLEPYVRGKNFSGSVLVTRAGKLMYERSFGSANREARIPNSSTTRFHVASISMQFTAAAILRLVDRGTLQMDEHVSDIVRGITGGDRITIRHLLEQRSGLTDINSLPDYDQMLQRRQTPAGLVAKIADEPLLFEPGSKYLHEEHSAYNLLALIIEKQTGKPFPRAMQDLLFKPAGLKSAVADDDARTSNEIATGYQPLGASRLEPATPIHWSAKAGNASVYLTARDQALWVDSLFRGSILSPSSRGIVLDSLPRIGYGWFRGTPTRLGAPAYYMNGRAPGFSSFVIYFPTERITVIALSNVYSSATTEIGYDIAAIATSRIRIVPFGLPLFGWRRCRSA
jgi:CubicO group peptidase (beta-lactamase class C family)